MSEIVYGRPAPEEKDNSQKAPAKKSKIRKIIDFLKLVWEIQNTDLIKGSDLIIELTPAQKEKCLEYLKRKGFQEYGDTWSKGFCRVRIAGSFAELYHSVYPNKKMFVPYHEVIFKQYINSIDHDRHHSV